MKIHLIAPAKEHVRITQRGEKPINSKMFRFSLLSLLSVAACTPDDIEISITDEQVEPVVYDGPFDLVGITFMTALAPRAYEIASEYRKRGDPVVFGGYHASLNTREAMRHCDAVCIGEAEVTWPRLIEDFKRGIMKRAYHSERTADLSNLKRPRRELINERHYITVNAVQASILTPLPGTALFERYRAQSRIIDTDWSHYDYRHVVFKPRLMAPEQLQDGADWFIQQFYRTGSIAKRAMKAAFQLGPIGNLLFALPLNIAYHTGSRKWVGSGRNPARNTAPRRFPSRGSTATLEWPVVSPIRDVLYCKPGAGIDAPDRPALLKASDYN